MPTLRVILPGKPEETYFLKGARVTLGRRPENSIQIIDPSISAHHAEFLLVDDHYRLLDLESTNQSYADGHAITDLHLHVHCRLTFGSVECDFNPEQAAEPVPEPSLTPFQLEKDVAFLCQENRDLRGTIEQLEGKIHILASARLVTKDGESQSHLGSPEVKHLREQRHAALNQVSVLKGELEELHGMLAAVTSERDALRRAQEQLLGDRTRRSLESEVPREGNKGTTQRIVFPLPVAARE